jgi:hypothetical protein
MKKVSKTMNINSIKQKVIERIDPNRKLKVFGALVKLFQVESPTRGLND